MASTALGMLAYAVTSTTSVSGARRFTSRSTWKPSAPGIWMSVTTTSKAREASTARACAPSAASVTA